MPRFVPFVSLTLLALALAACQVSPRAQTAATTASAAGFAVTTVGAGLADLGGPFSGTERTAYQQASGEALQTGHAVSWEGASGGFGRIVATSRPYAQAGLTCRDYAQSYHHGGRMFTDRGTACQSDDGAWARIN